VTARALGGLLALNACYLVAGLGLIAAFRPVLDRRDALRLLALGYMVGLAAVGTVVVQLTIVGVAPEPAVSVLVAAVMAVGGATVAVRSGGLRGLAIAGEPPREPFLLIGAIVAGTALLFLAALVRYAWIKPLTAWDSWAVWVPKGMALYFGGGLTPELFDALPARSYPLFVPVLQASAFEWMGAVATSALHVQWALLAIGFVFAVAALMRPFVPLVYVWPFLLLLLVVPGSRQQILRPEADFPVLYTFVLGALAMGLWIVRRERWYLVLATVFLAAGVTIKREGLLYLFAVGLAAFVVTSGDWRARWRPLALACAVAAAAAVPWHVWLRTHDVQAESSPPITGGAGIVGDVAEEPDRILPALEHVATTLFSYDLWRLAPALGLFSLGLALVFARDRRLSLLLLTTSLIAAAGYTWRILWGTETPGAFEEGALPTTRNVTALVFLWCCAAPLLLATLAPRLVDAGRTRSFGALTERFDKLAPALIVLPAAVFVAAGVARGDYGWESCERDPDGTGPVHVVFETTSSALEAGPLRDRIVALGFVGTTIRRDDCGRTRVLLRWIPSARVGREIIAEARPAGLDPWLVEP